ncbi:hypothetical protein EWH70_07505 [Amycolatopsis suaedae]|uniref:Mce-associated membrane protein n=2 Tax=Amycolatopsis suaedae TaxID=2510978 RepID=A0A4Q7JE33_9PSEU|nr:hypothetical protein EWH70_07505 [Amycolatopsis suaedae]
MVAPAEVVVAEPQRRPSRVLPLVVVALVLTGLGTWFTIEARQLTGSSSAANTALVDVNATAEVDAAVTSALNRIFSYSHADTAATERAAASVLRGKALDDYRVLFERVRADAPAQKLVLTSRVVSTAVQRIDGDGATVLAFLTQSATRAGVPAGTAAAQLSVTAQRVDGTWLITGLTPR